MRKIYPDVFNLDYEKIKSGYYSAAYFTKSQNILTTLNVDEPVLMQVFQKKHALVTGINEAAAIIHKCSTGPVVVSALQEGSWAEPWETVMTIEGSLKDFVHLESVYLGVLRDSTTVSTNMRKLVNSAGGKPVLYLADRFNGFENQERQGYAAFVGGAAGICTPAGVSRIGDEPIGTMPHALIAAFGGDVVKAAEAYSECYPNDRVVALVDFLNDTVYDSLRVAAALGDKLYAVRLDTSEKMVDYSIALPDHPLNDHFVPSPKWSLPKDKGGRGLTLYQVQKELAQTNGVNPQLVRNVREALDKAGYPDVKIVVSGGFNAEKISEFETNHVPADIYGVGSSVLTGGGDFTADVVVPVGKTGRTHNPNSRLEKVVI